MLAEAEAGANKEVDKATRTTTMAAAVATPHKAATRATIRAVSSGSTIAMIPRHSIHDTGGRDRMS